MRIIRMNAVPQTHRVVILGSMVMAIMLILLGSANWATAAFWMLSSGLMLVLTGVAIYGISLTRKRFTVNGHTYCVVDTIYPLEPIRNKRIISDRSGSYHASALHTNRNIPWAYFDSIRLLLDAMHPQPLSNALLVGGGGGTLAYTLARDYPALQIEVIEKSSAMASVAREYFLKNAYADRIRWIIRDAADLKEYEIGRYHLIIVDVAEGACIPDAVTSVRFLQMLKKHLSRNGLLFVNFNRLETSAGTQAAHVISRYRDIFPNFKLYFRNGFFAGVVHRDDTYSRFGTRIV